MAELLQPAPSLAFAHTGTSCSTFNRYGKGTLQEINRLPSANQSYRLSGLSDQPASLLPCWKEDLPAPRNTNQMCHAAVHNRKPQVLMVQRPVEHMVRLLRRQGGVLGETTLKKSSCLLREEKSAVMFILPGKLNPAINCTSN